MDLLDEFDRKMEELDGQYQYFEEELDSIEGQEMIGTSRLFKFIILVEVVGMIVLKENPVRNYTNVVL